MPEVRINLRGVARGTASFTTWPTKKAAASALKALRDRGLNADDCIRIHPADTAFFRRWVVARPDKRGEMTWLMRDDGMWIRGRLFDSWDSATWQHVPPTDGALIPPSFTHLTRTEPYHGRREQYRSKQNGSCGRWVMSDESVALCVCGWKSYASSRGEAQATARSHRAAVPAAA